MNWIKWFSFGVAVLAAVVLLDFGYSHWVEWRYRQWEATVERGTDGIRHGFESFQKGQGNHAILFVHGFASSPAIFSAFADHMAADGYHAVAIRIPGFGEPLKQARLVQSADWVETVTREARALREHHDTVWIVAHSLGGAISIAALAEDPAIADGLVLMAPLFEVSRARSPLAEPGKLYELYRRVSRFSDTFESVFPVDVHDTRLLTNAPSYRDYFIPMNIYDALFETAHRAAQSTMPPDLPILLFGSASDQIVDSDAAMQWLDRQPGPARESRMIEPAGHLLMLDTGWEVVLEEMNRFMATHQE